MLSYAILMKYFSTYFFLYKGSSLQSHPFFPTKILSFAVFPLLSHVFLLQHWMESLEGALDRVCKKQKTVTETNTDLIDALIAAFEGAKCAITAGEKSVAQAVPRLTLADPPARPLGVN